MTNIFRWVGGLFAAVGLIFVVVGGTLLQRDVSFGEGAAKAPGTVVELIRSVDEDRDGASGIMYTAVIGFVDESGQRQEFSEAVSSNPPRFAMGEAVTILYDPERPSSAVVDDFWGRKGSAMIFFGLGAVFAVVGITLLVIDLRRSRRISRLLRFGTPIEAEFLHVFRDTCVTRNGDNPFRVVAQAADPATGDLRRFESEPIWVDPTEHLSGRTVRVLIDPADPRRYHVDLSIINTAASLS